ncbi:hypothetical protein E3Q22_00512 [Wallemia mellicola]|uniref:Peroxisomal biogenesis factor 11 n=1 Tax=Wallemia mellicola TaxID=1708541 RepID=A0A4T0LBM8_9BASI|nr:hypothetical protein E3Q24_04385 [Wallemia mellicola]TIB71840.1 hypothetical protein E3Q23_03644 [Wallemia mellicola]TIB78441.1 hypothetical protein E3Q21_04383 [Wallemia mellicola]TIB82160.1 hypothetical protein E3Q22_00512 [Wallemia mellicola]TIB82976.1 hypothetical protein E3Q20_04364 [Wallemia mellicola]
MVRTPSYLPTTPWIEQAQRYGIPLSNTGKLLHAAMPNRMKVSTSQNRLLATDAGRDKIFLLTNDQKIIQYAIKLFLWRSKSNPNLSIQAKDWLPYLKNCASGLSTTRKCLILFAWKRTIPDLYQLLKAPKQPAGNFLDALKGRLTLISAIVQIPNSIADDFFCASKLGLVGSKTGKLAEKYGALFWWTDTFLQLNISAINEIVTNGQIRKLQSRQDHLQQCLEDMSEDKLSNKVEYSLSDETLGAFLRIDADIRKAESTQMWARLSALKYVCDFIFVSYDVFGFKKGQEGTQAIVGLTAGLLSTLKLWDKHYTSLSKVPDM